MSLQKAIRFTKLKLRHPHPVTGAPAFRHCLAVMNRAKALQVSEELQQVAVLHEVYENREVNLADLERRFGEAVAFMVYSLNRDPIELFRNDERGQYEREQRYLERLSYGISRVPELLTIQLIAELEDLKTISLFSESEYYKSLYQLHFMFLPFSQKKVEDLPTGVAKQPALLLQELKKMVDGYLQKNYIPYSSR